MRRAVFIIDGEHYMPVLVESIARIERDLDVEAVGAVFLGTAEKIGGEEAIASLDLPVFTAQEPLASLREAIRCYSPDMVIDLSDEPHMSLAMRMRVAAEVLSAGLEYLGADFRFERKAFTRVRRRSFAVFSVAKRAGKTAVCCTIARILKSVGEEPIIFTMSRGGPAEPVVVRPSERLTPERLLELAKTGLHAAADHYENAIFSGVATIGARRAGGGFSGVPFYTNVQDAIRTAGKMRCSAYVFEGSGSDAPPVEGPARVVLLLANMNPAALREPFNPPRLRSSRIALIMRAEEPFATRKEVNVLKERILEANPRLLVCAAVLRPHLAAPPPEGSRVVVASTAPEPTHLRLKEDLERAYGLEVVGITGALTNRKRLAAELRTLFKEKPSHLVTELKAAAVEVGIRSALARGVEVCLLENRPQDAMDWEPSFKDVVLQAFEEMKR